MPMAGAGAMSSAPLAELPRMLALRPLANITVPFSPPPPPLAPPPPVEGSSAPPLEPHIMGAIGVGLSFLLCVFACFICRVWRRNRYYSKVQRTLDEEERAFQECVLRTNTA